MRDSWYRTKYEICDNRNRKEMADLESEVGAINRLFTICEGGDSLVSSDDEVDRILECYPNAARALKRCTHEHRSDYKFDKYPLHVACRNNAPITVIQAMIQAWPGALQAPADHCLPLHEACDCGESLSTIKVLVAAWPDSVQQCTTDDDGYLPLDLALEKSEVSFDIIQFLVQQWPECMKKSRKTRALERALAHHQPYDIIHYLVQEWPDSIKICHPRRATPLHYACEYHHSLSTIQFLAQQCPAAVRIKACREIPLMCALRSRYTSVEIIAFLLDQWPESIKERKATDDAETCLLLALHQEEPNVEIISLLIDRYPDAVQIAHNKHGELPLHFALNKFHDPAVINLLVKSYPESVKVRDQHGTLPLYRVRYYAYNDRPLLTKVFLDCWPESILQQENGRFLPFKDFLTSNFQASNAVINLLIKAKPDILRVQDVDGFSPLHVALDSRIRAVDAADYLQFIKLLVENWPESLHMKTKWGGMLPLHLACNIGRAYNRIIWYLFHSNPQAVRVRDGRLRLPLHILCAKKTISKRLVQRFVQEWPASVRMVGRYSENSDIFRKTEAASREVNSETDVSSWELNSDFSEADADWSHFLDELRDMFRDEFDDILIEEADEEYDGDDNGWDGDNLEHNQGCIGSENGHCQRKDTRMLHYRKCQNDCDNEDLDESRNQEVNSSVSNDQYGESNYNGDYIYALPLDVACAVRERPSLELIRILTNGRPPLHFICRYSRTPWIPTRMKTIKYLASILPNDQDDGMQFFHGMLPFHWACLSGAPRSALEWWCEQFPAVITARTIHTHDTPLHCYLSSATTNDDRLLHCHEDSFVSTIQFLLEQYPDALNCTNRMGLFPFQVAALHDAALDVVFYLLCRNPGAITNAAFCCR